MSTETPTTARELDSRITDGIQVRMLWAPDDSAVIVSVMDLRNSESFVLQVQPGERAYDVFHHPFAYAAAHRVTTGDAPELAQAA